MMKTFNEPTIGVVEIRKNNVVCTSGPYTPSGSRPGYGSANTGNGNKTIWD